MESAVTQTQKKTMTFSDSQISLIKSMIAPRATDNELQLFLYQAKKTGLDPLTRQIYCIHRKTKDQNTQQWIDKMTIQTAIDGFRVIAERSGDYAGQDEPIYTEDITGKTIISCKVTVYRFRGDVRYPAAVGVAYWDEYVQKDREGKPMGLWPKMPHVMIAKVAEAVALRKAYPQDLSDIYSEEEMQQADVIPEDKRTVDELHAQFMAELNPWIQKDPKKWGKYNPDNWQRERTSANYLLAMDDLKRLTNGLS